MPGEVTFTHLGGPTLLIEAAGWTLLTDPTFDPPGRRYGFGFGTSSQKQTGPAIDAAALPPIDAVLLTHDHHADNLDDAGRAVLPGAGAVLTTTAGAGRLPGATGLEPWATHTLSAPGRPDLEITATPCRHGPPLSRPIIGHVIGFALRWPGQRHGALWVTGDTVLYDDLRAVPSKLEIGTMVLHLGAVRFGQTGRLRYTMTGAEGAELAGLAAPRTILPVHYEGWSHFHEGRPGVEAAFAAAPPPVRDALHWLTLGTPEKLEV